MPPYAEIAICNRIGATTVRIDLIPHSKTIKAEAQWEGSDPYVSEIEVDHIESYDDLIESIESGLLRNRVRG